MKKLIVILVIICLAFSVFAVYGKSEAPAEESPVAPETDSGAAAEGEEIVPVKTVDYDSIYALHEPDEVVAYVGDEEITWAEYFYMVFSNAKYFENQFNTYQMYYGLQLNWTDSMSDDPEDTFAAYAVSAAEDQIKQPIAIMAYAKENGIELSQENIDAMNEQLESEKLSVLGEGATDEAFNEFLAGIYLTREMYDEMLLSSAYYRENFTHTYGEDGVLVSDEDALQYLLDNSYMRADHILFKTVDDNYQPYEESVVAEKKALAEQCAAELAEIENEEERIARFYELKTQYTEDGGAVAYPEGYIFAPGKMVSAFEEGHNSLADNQISGAVESEYGYHIILRLPLDPNLVIEYSSQGTPLTARSLYADDAYAKLVLELTNKLEMVYVEGFEEPNLLDYLV